MHARSLAVFFDYVDPMCYLMEPALRRLEVEAGMAVERRPFELHPPPGRLLDADAPDRIRRWQEVVEPLAARLAMEIRRPRFIPWTRKAHELARYAASKTRFAEVHQALFRAHFLEGHDIGRIDVLVDIGRAVGLDYTETKVILDVDTYAEEVAEETRAGQRLGARDELPVILGPGGRRLVGFHPYEALAALSEGDVRA